MFEQNQHKTLYVTTLNVTGKIFVINKINRSLYII